MIRKRRHPPNRSDQPLHDMSYQGGSGGQKCYSRGSIEFNDSERNSAIYLTLLSDIRCRIDDHEVSVTCTTFGELLYSPGETNIIFSYAIYYPPISSFSYYGTTSISSTV